jgi:hypothetical protein
MARPLRSIFGPNRDEMTGGWRKLHNLYALRNIIKDNDIKDDELGSACNMCREMRNIYKILARKPEGMRPLGRSRHRWEHLLILS